MKKTENIIRCSLSTKKYIRNTSWLSFPLVGNLFYFLLLTFYFLLFIPNVFAEEGSINISADNIEYLAETKTYIAKGSVKITYENTVLNADEIQFNSDTFDSFAIGNVMYEDEEVIVKADKVELNFNTKLGTIHNSNIFYKSRNYHIEGKNIKRLGENIYVVDEASATTCDAIPPEWHFKGKDIKITLHENVKAKNATFYVKNIPVFYAPYFKAPLERQTGFLTPAFGHSNKKGFILKEGFFWAIKDNMDATIYMDYYHKKGIGKGLDYRYIVDSENNGELWLYHLRDNDLVRDFSEIKSYHNQKLYGMPGYLKIHFVNEFDYYNVLDSTSFNRLGLSTSKTGPFGFSSEERLQKYLESDIHISEPFPGGRVYLLGQYREAIGESSGTIPQSLPEIGFTLNTRNLGLAFLNITAAGTNFWKKDGQEGQRYDINPNVYFSFGRIINFTQRIGLRETAYFLRNPEENANRELFDIRSTLTTRFLKRYPSFVHIIEPSVEYAYIPVNHSHVPTFDSIDSILRTSDIIYSFTNRFAGSVLSGSEARLGLTQHFSLLNTNRPFSPVLIETMLSSRNLNISANAQYDVYDKNITDTIASLNLKGERGFISIGKNFRRLTSLDQYTIEAGLSKPIQIFGKPLPLDISGKLWYDLKGGGVQELNFKSTYSTQCWSVIASFTRKPFETQIMFGVEFRGFGSIKVG